MNDFRIKLAYTFGVYYERVTDAKFSDDLAVEYAHDSGEQYYRERLVGEITFVNDDYDFIMGTPLDAKVSAILEEYDTNTQQWTTRLNCYFYRTDCDINTDDKIITVNLTTDDDYTDFLGILDKEVDLIKIAPKITPIMLDKRPCLQVYAAGDTKLTCILSNMWWEQECSSELDPDVLENTHHFKKWDEICSVAISGTHTPNVPTLFQIKAAQQTGNTRHWTMTSGSYTVDVDWNTNVFSVNIKSGGTSLFYGYETGVSVLAFPRTMELPAQPGSGATGSCIVNIDVASFFVRLISDVDTVLGQPTFDIDINDIAGDNRNYTKVSPIAESGGLTIGANNTLSPTPTEWGIYQPSQYYTQPSILYGYTLPICKSRWSRVSYWITQSTELDYVEKEARNTVKLKDAYKLTDVIDAILAEVAPSYSLNSTFLGGNDPLGGSDTGLLYITPKSNLLNIYYTQPAQKAPITLRQILDMLRNTYRCFWELTINKKLRIEHILWFRKGGAYTGSPVVGVDLTAKNTVRNNKRWAYLTNKYKYDKISMPYRYEFGWMDDATMPFNGKPIEMLSNYVDKERIDKIQVDSFSSDIDYLMLNPSGASKDGFVIFKCGIQNIIASPLTVAGGTGTFWRLLNYVTDRAENIDVEYNCRGEGAVYAVDSQGNRISQLDNWDINTEGDGWTTTWNLPAGTAGIEVAFTDAGSFTLVALNPPEHKVIYWEYNPDNLAQGYLLQNGRMSFAYLQRYYDYDMPCMTYQIGSGQDAEIKFAQGVAKNKIQDVIFPTDGTFITNRVVTTGLGNGKIRKLSINLSSKMGSATLEYDTE